jgi:hypothetical protein
MANRARQRLISWIGIALILLNVLAPTVSHALQLQRLGTPGDLSELCTGIGMSAIDGNTDGQAPASSVLSACPFCTQAPAAFALPVVAVLFGLVTTAVQVQPAILVLVVPPEQITYEPALSRAPPALPLAS